ncbi:MAG: methyltransferase domain-containing protein [Oscillospiraceae bacterium]|nr:methyltransferase domain-containing protein [Oscillospiraceae bacterium]
MSETIWCCPVCGRKLHPADRSLKCEKGHSFDRSRKGDVHLLPSNKMHAKLPGDNPEMVRARRAFLSKGYYAHLLATISQTVCERLPEGGTLLDAGCGEGYYTAGVLHFLDSTGKTAQCYGVDISKTAAGYAAKADSRLDCAVASVFHLPVERASCDMLLSIFSPYCGEEFRRVLRPDGWLIMAIPAARHLWELKAAVYDTPYENAVREYALEGFTFEQSYTVSREIVLDDPQDIAALFAMTPYAYRTGAAERERLAALRTLRTEAAFEVLVYRNTLNKKENSHGI